MKRLLISLAAVLVLAVACEEEQKASLRSVSVEETIVKIPVGGTATVLFRVDEADYAFDLEKDVVLYMDKGPFAASGNFYLESVEKGELPGYYRAVIRDCGVSDDYDSDVSLGVRGKNGQMQLSSLFICRGEFGGPLGPAKKTGLPVLYIDTPYGAPVNSKETYLKMTLTLEENGVPADTLTGNIRGRGNTTWYWSKKPYTLKMDSKTSFFGFPAHKRWVLLANFMDRTLMRNLVAMKVSSLTSLAWTPRCRSVELVLNGRHEGTYLLIEQVKVDKNRVNVKDGYMLESDFHYDNKVQWMDPHGKCVQFSSGIPFGIKHPDEDEVTPDEIQFAKEYVDHVASVIYGPDFRDPEKGYASVIDVASFIDYWIVFEVMGNHELGNPGSVYYYFEKDGKMKAGPCWDFDWGVLSYQYNPAAQTGLVNGKACWYARLFEDPAFRAKVKARYEQLLPQLKTVLSYIDEMEKELQASAKLNFQKWNPAEDAWTNGGRIINGDENMSFTDAVARLRSIYEERLTVIQNNL